MDKDLYLKVSGLHNDFSIKRPTNKSSFELTLEIEQKYDEFAHQYDLSAAVKDFLFYRRLRRRLIRPAQGKVLEVAVGTGLNFPFYPRHLKNSSITVIDLSKEMLWVAEQRAKRLDMPVRTLHMNTEALDFPDQTFDTVIASFALCTYPNPIRALSEMVRVCRPAGRLLLLEHGRSQYEWLGKYQDRKAENHYRYLNCHLNREPLKLLEQLNLNIVKVKYFCGKTIYLVEAQPKVS